MSSPNKTTYENTTPASETRQRDQRGLTLLIAAAVVILDRITKRIVVQQLPNGQAHTVIPGIFRITDVHNTGAAFSMFAESASPTTVRNILIAFSVIAAIVLLGMLWRTGRAITLSSAALALILGGAVGNLYDRIRYSYVVDFLEVHIGSYHWPDFNIADSCIVIGACLLLIEIFRPQPSDN
jgi:signal peptidase II